MKHINILLYLSIIALIAGGLWFVKNNRYEKTVKMIEDLRDKTMVFYSSNFKRMYTESIQDQTGDMERLCIQGTESMKSGGLNSLYLKIDGGNLDPYTLSGLCLEKNLKKYEEYILVDISRGQSRHGGKYAAGGGNSCPITIILSKKSQSYDESLLFAGRVKSIIDKKYTDLPIRIVTQDNDSYNQSKGYIAMLVELGDAANTYEDGKKALELLCEAFKEVINTNTEGQ